MPALLCVSATVLQIGRFFAMQVGTDVALARPMAAARRRFWLGSVLFAVMALGASACGDDDTTLPPGASGAGGSGGKQPTAGQAGIAHAGNGGSAGEGGEPGCVDGLRVVKIVKEPTAAIIISWPTERRVGVLSGSVSIYELSDEGDVTLVETLGPEDLGLTQQGSIRTMTRYGSGLVLQGETGADPQEPRIVIWQPGAPLEIVPHPDAPVWLDITTADPEAGIAAMTRDGIRVARFDSDIWTWSEPFAHGARRSRALAIEDERILVGVEEADRSGVGGAGNEGGAAAGGAGGAGNEGGGSEAPSDSPHARVEWWSSSGERLESYEAVGNPWVAVKVSEGWLVGEINSFWGSYQAGIELLPNTGALHELTDVPVISAADGSDGARDLALLGDRLLVANCESGLLVGDWSTSSLMLSSLPGPWQRDEQLGNCSPNQVETQGDFAIIGGDQLVVARACE